MRVFQNRGNLIILRVFQKSQKYEKLISPMQYKSITTLKPEEIHSLGRSLRVVVLRVIFPKKILKDIILGAS